MSITRNQIRDESLADEALKRQIAKETKPHVPMNGPRATAILAKRAADEQASKDRMAEYEKKDRELNPYGRSRAGFVQATTEGSFIRTRDHAFSDQLRYEQNLKLQAEREEQKRLAGIRAKQVEREGAEARRLQELGKESKKWFLEYHKNNKDATARSWAIGKYSECQGICLLDETSARLVLNELHDPQMMRLYAPERFEAAQMTGLPKCAVCETYIQNERCLCSNVGD